MDPQSYYNTHPLIQVYGVEIPTRCFIGGLPYSMTELELNTFFSQFGTVKDSKIITDRNGVSKGYGFVTYETEQQAADVCARGSLYYNEKKLNISKAIRRQGGQYSKANQEYVNGQRLLYQSTEGYLVAQKNGQWVVEEPSPFCQPAKPCFQLLSPPPPVYVSGGHTATTTYLQSPVSAVTPAAYYQPLPPPPAMAHHLPLPPDPGTMQLYYDFLTPPPPPHSHPPHPPHPPPPHSHPPHHPPPLPQEIKSHTDNSICLAPDSTTSPQKDLTAVADTTVPDVPPCCEEEEKGEPKEIETTSEEGPQDDNPSVVSSTDATLTNVSSLSLDMGKCSLVEQGEGTAVSMESVEETTVEEEGGGGEAECREGTGDSAQRPAKTRPPNLPYLLQPPQHYQQSTYAQPQKYFTLATVHQCTL